MKVETQKGLLGRPLILPGSALGLGALSIGSCHCLLPLVPHAAV